MFSYHGWISSQLSQRSWSAQLAAVWQAQTAVYGVGPDADSERETEGRQGPFCYCHAPWEAGTLQLRRSDKQTSKIISPYPPVCVQWCKPRMLPDYVVPWAVYLCFKWIYSADIMSKTSTLKRLTQRRPLLYTGFVGTFNFPYIKPREICNFREDNWILLVHFLDKRLWSS